VHDAATLPSTATNNIIIIGAASPMGAKADYVGNPNNVTYTFPGDKVAVGRGAQIRSVPRRLSMVHQ
jgi:hypothetical protein